jgi:type I restriction enzyme S subunit
VYDASGVSTYINQFDMKENYIAIIKDGSGVGRVQYCKAYSSFIGTLGGIVAQNCNTYYLYSILDNIDFKNYITGATIPHIYYKDYKNIEIPFPQQAVRTQIEQFFRCLDKQCYNTEKTLEYLILLKKAMLQQLFI